MSLLLRLARRVGLAPRCRLVAGSAEGPLFARAHRLRPAPRRGRARAVPAWR